MIYIDPEGFLKLSKEIPIADVRSPGEFSHGHITNAINIPLFSDEERAIVGTIYNQKGRKNAIEKGIELASHKTKSLIKQAFQTASHKQLLVHCWRGGLRSQKMALLFEEAGIECLVLKGGYKNYRRRLFEDFKYIKNIIVLYGKTGTGKTEILHELNALGEQIIDLEFYAKHRGSAFGDIGLNNQPNSMQFQNNVHHCYLELDQKKNIWIEGESLSIGKVYLPNTLWETMCNAKAISIEIPKELRIERIVNEYGKFKKELLIESINKIRNRYGGDRTQEAIQLVTKNELHEAVKQLLTYYDTNYYFSLKKYHFGEMFDINSNTANAAENAKLLLNQLKKIKQNA